MARIDSSQVAPKKTFDVKSIEARMSRLDGVKAAELADGDPGWQYTLASLDGTPLERAFGIPTDGERLYVFAGTAYDVQDYLVRGYVIEQNGVNVRWANASRDVAVKDGPMQLGEFTVVSISIDEWRRNKAAERARTQRRIAVEQETPIHAQPGVGTASTSL